MGDCLDYQREGRRFGEEYQSLLTSAPTLRKGRLGGAPSGGGGLELGAEGGPFLGEDGFVDEALLRRGYGGQGAGPFVAGDLEEFGEVDFLGGIGEEASVKDKFGGVGFLADVLLELAVGGAVGDEAVEVDVLG